MPELTMTIAGREAPTLETLSVEDPATGSETDIAPNCTAEQVDSAMNAASTAFEGWREDRVERQRALKRLAETMTIHLDELAELITTEEGKPLSESRSEIEGAIGELRYFGDFEIDDDVLQDNLHATVKVVRRPIGVVAAITPWNFPLGTAVAKIAPALAAGCTMVLKPSPFTPLSCLRFGELTREVLPAGVLNVLSGSDQVGAWMSEHPIPRMTSFTGSVATGKRVAAAAATDLKRITLELGGNDPAIILDDADVSKVADGLFANAFGNCGQICVAIKRVYVPEELHDELIEALVGRATSAQVGDGHEEGTEIGPLVNKVQLGRVAGLVKDAVSHGARVAAGGETMPQPGYFFEPTILTDLDDTVRIVSEEQFGPALPILRYRDIKDALRRANDSHFGLGASIWTSDPDRGAALADSLDSGTVWVNTHQEAIAGQPCAGFKWSGIGVEGGPWGFISFTEVQARHIARDQFNT
jgi:acyl-CoA reductase-like NAD-dependent aldehyde dehydrogenase